MQTIVTFLLLASAAIYAARRIYRLLKGRDDPCKDCQMKKNCRKFGQSKEM